MTEPRYNGQKFREMLLYVAEKSMTDLRCGDIKLNKLLYFADVTAYRRHGSPITGASYKHLEHGPIATALKPARRQLEHEHRVKEGQRAYFNRTQTCTDALDKPDTTLFDADELAILDEVIEKYWDFDADAMEAEAHKEPGWLLTEEDEIIPYRASLIGKKASPKAIARGQELAQRLGW